MFSAVLQFIAGVGLLIYGVFEMSAGLEKITGSAVRKNINKFAKNRFANFLFGFTTTVSLQSSTAATIMIVGFSSAGIITLFQALGMVIGSNVGTSLTPFLLYLKTIKAVNLLACVTLIGAILLVFRRNPKLKQIGITLLGFGILFCGLMLIDEATTMFKTVAGFDSFLLSFNNPFLLLLIGILLTVILQSSFGTIAILISLAGSVAGASLLPLTNSAFIVYGANIGTCLTAIIAAIPGSKDSKRVALFHLLFNCVGVIVFSLLSLTGWINWLEAGVSNPTLQIILIDIIFNSVVAILFLPFMKIISKWFAKLFTNAKENNEIFNLDSDIVQIPTIAIKQINFAVLKSFKEFKDYLYLLNNFINNPNQNLYENLSKRRDYLKRWNNSVSSQAIRMSGNLNITDTENITLAINVLSNYNRAIEYAVEIIGNINFKNSNVALTVKQKDVTTNLGQEVINILNANIEMFKHIYDEDKNLDYSKISLSVLDCSEYITKLKNEQKKSIVAENYSKEEKLNRNSQYLSIVNLFDSIGAELADATVNITNFEKMGAKTLWKKQ